MRSWNSNVVVGSLVVLLFAVATQVRYAVESVGDGYTLLYVLPVTVAALHFRLLGGLVSAAVAVILVVVWAQVEDAAFTLVAYLTRAMVFFVLGGAVGFATGQLRRAQHEQERLLAYVEKLARTDSLTGLANRRAWDETLQREVERSARAGSSFVVALLDLDRFKDFNDQHGHPAGDELLRRAAEAWASQLRLIDTVARYGGEEFAVILPECSPDRASDVVERLRAATPMDQTVSAGIAYWDGVETAEALVERADQALYGAKSAGRDCCVIAAPA